MSHQEVTSIPPLLPLTEWQVILNVVYKASKVFDLLKIGELITPGQLCVADQLSPTLPCWWSTVNFFCEWGSLIIWLLRDSTGVLASRQAGLKCWCGREGGEWGYCCFRFPASQWRGGQRSNGETGGKKKHIWYPVADSWESVMQTSYMNMHQN